MATNTLDPPMHFELLQELEQIELPETDGVPLESDWHRDNINLLVDSLKNHWKPRQDFYAGGNMCIYYSVDQAKNRDFLGPDVFVINGRVDGSYRRNIWTIWRENNRGLDVAIELSSPSSVRYDRLTKKDLYEKELKTPEYFVYDPDTQQLSGWRLDLNQKYQPIEPASNGMLWSDEVELWLGKWTGVYSFCHATWLRWFDHRGNVCLLLAEDQERRAISETQRADAEAARAEAEAARAEAEATRAEAEAARAEAEAARAEAEATRAEAATARATAEADRANEAEAEIRRLKELLNASNTSH